MPREEFQGQLADLRANVRSMGEVVTERLEMGLDAIENADTERARTVADGDAAINEMYLEIERQCIDLLALQQPVAGDLRFVVASFKIITDLERIADLAANLGEYTLSAEREAFPTVDLRGIGAVAAEMLERAMDAYATEDTWASHEVAALDNELDELRERAVEVMIRNLLDTDARGAAADRLMHEAFSLSLAVRDLERVGDHAVNIAARTLYIAENDPVLIY